MRATDEHENHSADFDTFNRNIRRQLPPVFNLQQPAIPKPPTPPKPREKGKDGRKGAERRKGREGLGRGRYGGEGGSVGGGKLKVEGSDRRVEPDRDEAGGKHQQDAKFDRPIERFVLNRNGCINF